MDVCIHMKSNAERIVSKRECTFTYVTQYERAFVAVTGIQRAFSKEAKQGMSKPSANSLIDSICQYKRRIK